MELLEEFIIWWLLLLVCYYYFIITSINTTLLAILQIWHPKSLGVENHKQDKNVVYQICLTIIHFEHDVIRSH